MIVIREALEQQHNAAHADIDSLVSRMQEPYALVMRALSDIYHLAKSLPDAWKSELHGSERRIRINSREDLVAANLVLHENFDPLYKSVHKYNELLDALRSVSAGNTRVAAILFYLQTNMGTTIDALDAALDNVAYQIGERSVPKIGYNYRPQRVS